MSNKESQSKKKPMRVQVEFSPERHAELERLMEETQTPTKHELFNNALTFLKWAVRERQAGRTIESVDLNTGGRKEIVMSALENATSKPQNPAK